MTELATCSFSEFRPNMGAPVRTSLGTPRWFPHDLPAAWLDTAPDGWMLKQNYDTFRRVYFEKLDRIGVDKLLGDVDHLARSFAQLNGGKEPDRLVLLCFEGLKNPDKWCHRTLFAEWWVTNTGEPVAELGATAAPPVPEDPMLF